MNGVLVHEPLSMSHADDLCAVLPSRHVYRFIVDTPPTREQYRRRMESILDPSPGRHPGIMFDDHVVRLKGSGAVAGLLEATFHDGIAEVASLFGPAYWGKGHATVGLNGLCARLRGRHDVGGIWAATDPDDERSVVRLSRCGFRRVAPRLAPEVFSHDPGKLVFAQHGVA